MESWEDELLWDDDFSDEEEDTEEQIEEADLEMDEDGFADWEDASDGAPENESLEEALAKERTLELESELEQDEHPRDYDAELEDEEEEAAPTSEKRLKREIRAEALRRLEEAARTESDFLVIVDEWNKLDRNRERRERDHENLRGDVPLEFQAVPDPKIAPLWMNLPRFRQLCQGNFLDIIFSCPYELHQLTANRFLSKLFFTLSDEQKEVLYYLFVKQYSTTRLAAIREQSDRNIRKLRMTIQKKLQRHMYVLGKLLLSDDLEVHDPDDGIRWMRQAAENGNHFAAYRLGKEYLTGEALTKDTSKAAKWFTQSAEAGNQYAQYMLGKLYLTGQGVIHDRTQALDWFSRSAAQGNQYAQFFLERQSGLRPPSVMLAVTRLLYHMSRIFEDHSLPRSSTGLQVDSKLRRKIQEKKIAMGHKPDDHEEAQNQGGMVMGGM